jgi:hypothetical protein
MYQDTNGEVLILITPIPLLLFICFGPQIWNTRHSGELWSARRNICHFCGFQTTSNGHAMFAVSENFTFMLAP